MQTPQVLVTDPTPKTVAGQHISIEAPQTALLAEPVKKLSNVLQFRLDAQYVVYQRHSVTTNSVRIICAEFSKLNKS
jgi:hypothetical protein